MVWKVQTKKKRGTDKPKGSKAKKTSAKIKRVAKSGKKSAR